MKPDQNGLKQLVSFSQLNMPLITSVSLLDSRSDSLILSHPTPEECHQISINTSAAWKDSLTLPLYLEESRYLITVPLARDGGLTTWILVDKTLPLNQRPILASCESFRKRSLTSDSNGQSRESIIHGIVSVFCLPEYRNRGYPQRMLEELALTLHTWQRVELSPCVGSILYSDIGPKYYAKLGWRPNETNTHLAILPKALVIPSSVSKLKVNELSELCAKDEAQVRKIMAVPIKEVQSRITIIPDIDHMLWHIAKEDFACEYIFGRTPVTKGAIAGPPGSQVWVIWAHRYYSHPDSQIHDNVLYILRLVVEADETATRLPSDSDKRPSIETYKHQLEYLKAVLEAAQAEAAEWKLDIVKLWDPTPLVQDMMLKSGMKVAVVERTTDSIASALWYDDHGAIDQSDPPLWVNNEHYAWC